MAKVVKDTRETIDVDLELSKIESKKKSTSKTKDSKTKKTASSKNSKQKKKTKITKKHSKIITFLKEVKSEVSKVKWPSKKDMVKYSAATIVFVIFFALFFYIIDLIIALLKAGV